MFITRTLTVILLLTPLAAYSKVSWVKNEKINPEQISSARIIYHAEVNAQQVSELILTLDEINNFYPALKEIKLYISSFGGSMESGYLAYQAIKASAIPVETINAGITGSAATLLYCGAKKRHTFPDATFIMHPAATPNSKREWLQPNDIELLKKDVADGNKYFFSVYRECLALQDREIARILSSSEYTRYIRSAEAKKIALSQDDVSGIASAQVSYFITTDNEGK